MSALRRPAATVRWGFGPAREWGRRPRSRQSLSHCGTEKVRDVGTESKQADPQTALAAEDRGRREVSKPSPAPCCSGSGEMKLHCEVEVVSRLLPALGLRNRGKGVRAVLVLCQQTPKSPPRPPAGRERGGPHPAHLLISTRKDKRGTRYEVRGAGRQTRPLPPGGEASPPSPRRESV